MQIVTQTQQDRNLNAAAIAAADAQADADAGRRLYRELQDKWRDQGRQAFLDGDSILSCWNCHQQEGYDAAAAEYEAVVEEQDSKPELGVMDYAPVSVQYVWEVTK